MIRFIHTADTHFGVENYGKLDPKTGIHSRLLDFKYVLDFCVEKAIKQKVDFFLFCGDAYKTTNPTPTQQKLFMNCLFKLYQHNIPVILVIGNHDNPLSFGKAHSLDVFGNLPLDGFHIISKPNIITLQTKNGPIQIVGIPWPTRNTIAMADKHLFKSADEVTNYISQAVGTIIQSYAQQLDPTLPAVLAGHLTVSTGVFSGSERRAIYGNDPVLLPSQLAMKPFDYVALGHLHRHQNLNTGGYPSLVYCGSPERIDFGERSEEKGFCLVTIEEKNKTTYQFITTPARPFVQIECILRTDKNQTDQLLDELKKHKIENAIVKIKYHVPEERKDHVDPQIIQQACSCAHHLASIIPIKKIQLRERRSDLKVDMDFTTLLGAYLDTKPELKEKKARLLEKASLLFEQTKMEKDHSL
jgi:DNA repair protein SbcD/Mre11